jgi:hypothetical protein
LPDAEFFGWIQNSFVEEGVLLPDSKLSCFKGYGYGFKSNFSRIFQSSAVAIVSQQFFLN